MELSWTSLRCSVPLSAELVRAQGQLDWVQLMPLHACGEPCCSSWRRRGEQQHVGCGLGAGAAAAAVFDAEEPLWTLCPLEALLADCALPASLSFAHLDA